MKKTITFCFLMLFFSLTSYAKSTFNGVYLGGGVGKQSGDTQFNTELNTKINTDFDSPFWEANAGLGHSLFHFLYLGVGAKYQSFSDAKTSSNNHQGTVDVKSAAFGVITPGILITQKTLLYANLGLGEVDAKYSNNKAVKTQDSPHYSWSTIYGVGIKRGLNNHISIGAEYNRVLAGSAGISNNISKLNYNEGLVNLTFYL